MTPEAKAGAVKAFLLYLEADGCCHPVLIDAGRYAAIRPFMFTAAIVIGKLFDYESYDDRWCYSTVPEAKAALDQWNGIGEPTGWHRHPNTGRRVSKAPTERDENGRLVPLGAMYVRG